jgi:hypothetical protein
MMGFLDVFNWRDVANFKLFQAGGRGSSPCLKARVFAAKKEMSDRRLAARLLSHDHVLNHLR